MGYTDAARNAMVAHLATQVDEISLHTGLPGDTGANEVSGGSPPYARQAPTWGTASGGSVNIASIGSHQVPAGTTLMYQGFWKSGATPTFHGFAPLGSFVGVFTCTDAATDIISLPAHGLVLNATVVCQPVVGRALPGGLAEGILYYVRDVTADTFKISLTAGGAAYNITSTGAGVLLSLVQETFPLQGTYTVSTGTALRIR